jgi:hypothetical protein
MTLINCPKTSVGLDIASICKPWTTTLNNGDDARMMNRAQALVRLAQMLNHCLGRYPRVMFAQNMKQSEADSTGADPVYEWYYDDQVNNGRSSTISIVGFPRTAGAGNAYAARYGGGATERTSYTTQTVAAVTLYTDTRGDSYAVARGAAAASEINEAVSTFNGYTITGLSVQDDDVGSSLDTSIHDYVVPEDAKKGAEVLDDLMEQIRAKLYALQTSNLSKIISWSAQRLAAGWQTPSTNTSVAGGIATNSATYVNVIDQSITARTATSPGLTGHVRNRGWGANDETNGTYVKVMVRVHGKTTGAGGLHGKVKFEGPIDSAEVTITNGAAQTWWGTGYIHLDSTKADTDVTAARNKIDVFAKIDVGVTNEVVYIYGLSAWQDCPPY